MDFVMVIIINQMMVCVMMRVKNCYLIHDHSTCKMW